MTATALLTISEVAERLSISARTVRRLVDRRELAETRVGRSVRIPLSSVEDFVDRNTRPALQLVDGDRLEFRPRAVGGSP